MSTPLRIGILGGGNWTRTVYLPNLRRIPGVEVIAVTTANPDRRARLRETWETPIRFSDTPEPLLADPEVDAVIVCTPNHTHAPLSHAALAAGKHVFCEKPPAFSVLEVDRLATAAATAGRIFQVDLELGFSDVIATMREQIAAGAIGEPKLLSCLLLRDWGAFRGWRGDPAQSGGMFLELGIHYLDLLNLLAGGNPARVTAAGGHASGAGLPDYLTATVAYDTQAVAELSLTVLAAARNEIRIHVIGTEARLEGEIIEGRVELWRRRTQEPVDLSPARPEDYRWDGFPGSQEALAAWVDAIRRGTPLVPGLAAARKATAVAAAAEEALRSGQPIAVER